jgi:hypothetical protein
VLFAVSAASVVVGITCNVVWAKALAQTNEAARTATSERRMMCNSRGEKALADEGCGNYRIIGSAAGRDYQIHF